MFGFLARLKEMFLAVIKWVVDGIRRVAEAFTDENVQKAQRIAQQSLMVLSRQFWEMA